MEFLLLLGIFSLLNGVSACVFIPNKFSPLLILCQGREITQFPLLADEQKEVVESIIISQTFISKLPVLEKLEYTVLYSFDEIENVLLNCSYIYNWKKYQTNTIFISECPMNISSTTYKTTSTFITEPTTIENTYKTEDYETSLSPFENITLSPGTPPSGDIEPYVIVIIVIIASILFTFSILTIYFKYKNLNPSPRQNRENPYLQERRGEGVELQIVQNPNYSHSPPNPRIYIPNSHYPLSAPRPNNKRIHTIYTPTVETIDSPEICKKDPNRVIKNVAGKSPRN